MLRHWLTIAQILERDHLSLEEASTQKLVNASITAMVKGAGKTLRYLAYSAYLDIVYGMA